MYIPGHNRMPCRAGSSAGDYLLLVLIATMLRTVADYDNMEEIL